MKCAVKISNNVLVVDRQVPPCGLGQFDRLVEGHLAQSRAHEAGRVPRAAICATKPCASRMRMTERRVDDRPLGNTKHQFVPANATRQRVILCLQASVGCGHQLHQRPGIIGVVGQCGDERGLLRGECCRNQPVCIIPTNIADRRPLTGSPVTAHCPRRASSNARTRSRAGIPPAIMTSSGVRPPNMALVLGRFTHSLASAPG